MTLRKYLGNVGISLSQVGNALIGGDPDETISSRLGKSSRRGNKAAQMLCRVISMLFFDKKHCFGAIEEDEGTSNGKT